MIGSTRYVAQAQIASQTRLAADIAKLQTSISTRKRLSAASEDPAAAARISEIRQTQADHTVWSRNADTGAAIAGAADTALNSLGLMLTRAKELVLQGRNDTNGTVDRSALATELRGIAQDTESLAGSSDPLGQALFPATATIPIPVGEGEDARLSATDTRANVFDTVATAGGTRTIAQVLRRAADALEAGSGGIPALDTGGAPIVDASGATLTVARGDAITASIDAVDAAAGHVTAIRTDQGLRAQRFDDAKASLAASDPDLAEERSGLEDTDYTYAISEFQTKQLALDAAQKVFAQTHKSNLFDLLG